MKKYTITAIAAVVGLLSLGACAPPPATTDAAGASATTSPAPTVPGTKILVADLSAAARKVCGLQAETNALVNGVTAALSASPAVGAGVLTAQVLGGLACSYLNAATAPAVTVTAKPASS